MKEKKYLELLRNQIQPQRVICGFNQDAYGKAFVITGIPRKYNDNGIVYVEQKVTSYDEYMFSRKARGIVRSRARIYGKVKTNFR